MHHSVSYGIVRNINSSLSNDKREFQVHKHLSKDIIDFIMASQSELTASIDN